MINLIIGKGDKGDMAAATVGVDVDRLKLIFTELKKKKNYFANILHSE
jgi:hypothetical protein